MRRFAPAGAVARSYGQRIYIICLRSFDLFTLHSDMRRRSLLFFSEDLKVDVLNFAITAYAKFSFEELRRRALSRFAMRTMTRTELRFTSDVSSPTCDALRSGNTRQRAESQDAT